MSLNNISFPASLIADLYHRALVQDTARPVPEPKPLPFLGKNGKNILVVVNNADLPYLPDGELAFLTNVLSACGLGLMDVAILNWQTAQHAGAAFVEAQFGPSAVLLFDVPPAAFGLPALAPYAVGGNNRYAFLAAPSLSTIEGNKDTKKQLWLSLKQLFGI